MSTRVVNIRHHEPYDVYIGRPGRGYSAGAAPWGNPFVVGRDGDLRTVLERYRAWLFEHPTLLGRLEALRGKRLGCFCAPRGGLGADDRPFRCHGQVLADLAGD